MYNQAAPNWHRLIQRLGVSCAYIKLFQSLQQSATLDHIKENSIICGCGVGTGAFSLALTKTVSSKIKVIGVDISPEMLILAHQHFLQTGINHEIYQGDVNQLPFDDNSFDLVISAHMLEHLPNPAAGLQEMVRVLRPGAPLIIAVTRPGILGFWLESRWGNGCLAPNVLTKIMSSVGLTDICLYPFTFGLSRCTSIACVGIKSELKTIFKSIYST
ncbi:ubiquinone/menaquinone biosynthesis methyltransferase (plasmid) [Calothrix sp. NIES-4071]|nr:ubiquinone/menaquinone biosynthesis methyltransferase [Calothrix sp. NIES-4071]BAZ64416.1 ubiquinone/menaquinone biosynthesis methyltransferase [Calothrix sp. NIES-4105]